MDPLTNTTPRLDLLNIDANSLKEAVAAQIHDTIKALVTDAAADVRNFGISIGQAMILAQQEPDEAKREKLLTELRGQLQAVGELNRIRLNQAAWAQFERAFDFGFAVLDRALALGIAAI